MALLDDWSNKITQANIIAGKYGEGGANTPVNRNTMPWLYEDDSNPLKEPAGKDPKEVFEQLELPLDLVQRYRMMGDGVTEFWDTDPADRYGPRGKSKYDEKIQEMRQMLAPIFKKAAAPYSPNPSRDPIDLRTDEQKIKMMETLYGPKTPKGRYQASIPESYKREGIGNTFDRWMEMSKGKKLTDEEKILWHKIGVKLHGV